MKNETSDLVATDALLVKMGGLIESLDEGDSVEQYIAARVRNMEKLVHIGIRMGTDLREVLKFVEETLEIGRSMIDDKTLESINDIKNDIKDLLE